MSTPKAPKAPTSEAEATVMTVLVKNTEALTNLNAVLAGLQTECADGKRMFREAHMAQMAKLDNLDRTVAEMKLTAEHAEASRQGELQRIFTLLGDERKDRREVTASAGKDERELLREMIREEMGERRRQGGLFTEAGKAIWAAGGRYIVLAVALLVVAEVMKVTGLSLADFIGITGK